MNMRASFDDMVDIPSAARMAARMAARIATCVATLLAAATLGPATLRAQQPAETIDSGMTQAQVIARLGTPLSVRSTAGHTYLFYRNGCEKTCGINDLVVLDSGKVVDAVFRSPGRKYSGKSSSPNMIPAADARKSNGTPLRTAKPSDTTKPSSNPAAKPSVKKPPLEPSPDVPGVPRGARHPSEGHSP
ncbi:MAG TPA: hypothetical protein VH277_09195 [Gemmatimonadaceae bacterium]|jgi:hypothetical protein|nr:hypothetical protein [Gemmatimonadaceae bacterium]